MHLLGVVGSGATELCERVAPLLDGRVATVESLSDVSGADATDSVPSLESASAADAAYGLGPDGSWVAAGEGKTLGDVLDELAARYDYALLSGFPDADVPTVALGGAPAAEAELEAEDAESVELDAVAELAETGEPHVTLERLVERAKASPRAEYAGAIATFTGRVRAKDEEDDARTVRLEFEKYDGVAEERMATIESELADREGVEEVLTFHRTGVVEDGDDIVFVVVLAGHRREAFRAVEDGIDRLKDEVPLFKKETTVEDDFWVHDRP
ncbi:molybdopterin synthase [Halopelagius longus]|uniref:Molybdopterin synthase n=1 Tax=Halopelagius longus TaxID=1236180 RepID=A0A1H0XSY1_9EURY|nr:molybdopterin synthase [Halopelagius longus]RDI72065.1 molybdopterin synthase [Halopelagius longus]SDQ05911.1 molybdopterin synthase subunit MoaE /molybdopterin guanine dinucleotide biosynthesis accessory protein MobB [Halopelagius longus]